MGEEIGTRNIIYLPENLGEALFFLCGNLINTVSPSAEGFLDKTLILKNQISKKEREKHKNTEEKKRFQQFSLDSDGEHACRVVAMVTVTSSRAKGRCGWRGFSPSLWLLQ